MRRLLVLLILLFGSAIQAESPSYEARFGLITVGGFVIFFNSEGPLSFVTLTMKDLPQGSAVLMKEIEGQSCQYGISIPIFLGGGQRTSVSGAGGDGGYRKALLNIKQNYPQLDGIYDVKIDSHQLSILGIYKRICTEIVGRGFIVGSTEESADDSNKQKE